MPGKRKGLSCKKDLLNPQELVNLLFICKSPKDRFIVYNLVYAGLRVSELVHLRRTWINWKERTLTVPIEQECECKECNYVYKSKSKGGIWKPKTEQGHRKIRIHPSLLPVMKEFLSSRDSLGLTRQRVWQRIKELKDELPLGYGILHNIYPHCLRATCATELARDKISSSGLQHVLGWARLSSAESYVRSGEQRAIAEQDEIYDNITKKA